MSILHRVRAELSQLKALDPLPIYSRLKLLAPVVLSANFVLVAIAVQATGDDCIEVRNPQAALSNMGLSYLSSIQQPTPIHVIQQSLGVPLCKLNNGWLQGITQEDTSYPSERLAYPLQGDPNAWVVLHVLASTGDFYGYNIQRYGSY